MKKIILVTGASRGIGNFIAEDLLNKGHTVYGTSRSIENKSFPFNLVELDVTKQDSIDNCINHILEKEGKVDVLINNAGFVMAGPLEKSTIEDVIRQLDTNFFGIHRMIQSVLPTMKKQNEGRIINIGSFGGRLALPFQSLYSCAKAAVAIYSDALRMELYTSNIKIALIEPGDTKTGLNTTRINVTNYNPDKYPIVKRSIDLMLKAELNGSSPKKITKTIDKIMKTKQPKPRYTTGPDAKILGVLLRFMPFKTRERLIMRFYKVPRK